MPSPFVYTIKTVAELQGAEAALAIMERENGKAMALGKALKYSSEQTETARSAIAKYRAEVAEAAKADQAAAAAAAQLEDARKLAAQAAQEKARATPVRVDLGRDGEQRAWSSKGASQSAARAQAEAEERARLAEQTAWAQKNTAIRVQPPKKPGELYDLDTERARTQSQLQFNVRQAAQNNKGSGVGAWLSGVNKELVDVVPGLARVEMIATKLATGPLGLVAAGFTAIAAAAKVAKSGVQEFAQAQTVMARADTALAQIGQYTDANRAKMQAFAEAQQTATGISGERWLDIARRILQFSKNIETLDRDAEMVKNLAGVTENLEESVTAVGKALQGEFDNFSRYGIYVDQAATQTQKLDNLQRQLARMGGGQLEAATQTLSGRFSNLRNQSNDLLKAIGQIIVENTPLQRSIDWVATSAEFWAQKLGHAQQKTEGLYNSLKILRPTADQIARAIELMTLQMGEFDRSMSMVRDSISAFGQGMQAVFSGQTSVMESEHARQIALVDSMLHHQVISEKQAADQKLAINLAYENQKLEAKRRSMQLENEMDQERLMREKGFEKALQDELALVTKRAAESAANEAAISQADAEGKRVQRHEKILSDAQAKYDELLTQSKNPNNPAWARPGIEADIQAVQQDLPGLKRNVERAKEIYEEAKSKVKPITQSPQELEEEKKAVKARLQEQVTVVRRLEYFTPRQAEDRKDAMKLEEEAAKKERQRIKIEADTNAPESGYAPGAVNPRQAAVNQRRYVSLQNRIQRNVALEDIATQATNPSADQAKALLAALQKNGQDTTTLFTQMLDLIRSQGPALGQIQTEIAQLKAWYRNGNRNR